MTYIALAAAGGAAYYFFFRKPPPPAEADPMITLSIQGMSGSGTIRLSQACSQARALKAAGNPDWQTWAIVCQQNGGTV
jgi:hypothetical protein